jgi:FtsP/CotA-like multicopper oxidase with cupredoxin domain
MVCTLLAGTVMLRPRHCDPRIARLILVHAALVLGCNGSSHIASADPGQQPAGWDGELRIPDAPDTNPDPAVVEISLEARTQTLSIVPGQETTMWTYNGTVPGPIIRATKGNRLIVHFRNSLPEPTTIHWHGVRVPNAMDGSSMTQAPVPPGGTFDYDFVLPDAGTYWYHPHIDSSAQVGYGLYGVLVVEDPAEPPLGDELVLVLSDVNLNSDGSLLQGDAGGWFGDYFGREGSVHLVNGRVRPKLRMRAGVPQRWRVVDASRAQFDKVLVPEVTLQRVAGDDGLSAAPVAVDRMNVVPGEREELVAIATAAPGSTLTAMSQDADRFHVSITLPDAPLFDIEISGDPPWHGAPPLPGQLASISPLDVSSAPVRMVTFQDVIQNGTAYLGIDGQLSTDTVDVTAGATEIWQISNTTSQDHPFHMHGFPFQVVSVGGAPPAVLEWRDTVNVPAQGILQLAVHFDDRPGMWMFHCHILDHAEMGMMAMLVVHSADTGGD